MHAEIPITSHKNANNVLAPEHDGLPQEKSQLEQQHPQAEARRHFLSAAAALN